MAYDKAARPEADSKEEIQDAEEKKYAYSVVKRITRSITKM